MSFAGYIWKAVNLVCKLISLSVGSKCYCILIKVSLIVTFPVAFGIVVRGSQLNGSNLFLLQNMSLLLKMKGSLSHNGFPAVH